MTEVRAITTEDGTTVDPGARPRASVIIPHLNTPDLLRACLTSVTGQRIDHGKFEVIVVDNGSRMPLVALQTEFPSVCFLVEPAPGPGLARNRGVAEARAPVLAFIDADCVAQPGWLQAAIVAVEALPGRGVVGGDVRIGFVDQQQLTAIEAYEAVFGFRQQMYIEKKHFSVTANMAIAAPVHASVGPFGGIDMAEDLDWGRRAHAAGYPVRYLETMRVQHPARSDFDALARKWQRHTRHDYNEHVEKRRPRWRWYGRALAMILSIPPDSLKLFTSDRLTGVFNRCRGVGMLARIRWFRAGEMVRVAGAGVESGGDFWNRN